jgi:hypothetical protein
MGTRYEDQPAEHWAGAESLDPTPVWKQYALVGILLIVGLVVVAIVAITALAPTFATPPALVFGDRLVLASSTIPPVGSFVRIGPPIVDEERAFYLVQPEKGNVVALRVQQRGQNLDLDRGHVFVKVDAVDQYLVSVSGDRVIVNLSRVIQASERTSAPIPTGIPQPQATP